MQLSIKVFMSYAFAKYIMLPEQYSASFGLCYLAESSSCHVCANYSKAFMSYMCVQIHHVTGASVSVSFVAFRPLVSGAWV